MNRIKNIIVLMLAVLVYSCSNGQEEHTKSRLSALEFSEQVKNTDDIQLIDVRSPAEFEKGHIKHAVNINVNDDNFEQRVAQLDKKKPAYVYCLSGGRSAGAAAAMRRAGFEQVIEMPGGMMEWRAANLPEVKGRDVPAGMTMAQYEALLDTDKLVLVDFYADWCAPCKKMEPYLSRMAKEMSGRVVVVRIDADANTALCKANKVTGLPVLKLYKDKQVIWEKQGFADEQEVKSHLQ